MGNRTIVLLQGADDEVPVRYVSLACLALARGKVPLSCGSRAPRKTSLKDQLYRIGFLLVFPPSLLILL